jgi:integrase
MARKIYNSTLDTRTARLKLEARGKPYWIDIGEPGTQIGYRRLSGRAGSWCIRHYVSREKGYVTETVAVADDLSDSNHVTILTWHEMVDRARGDRDHKVQTAAGLTPFTVKDAYELRKLSTDKPLSADNRRRFEKMILPTLGHIPLADLTTDQIEKWRDDYVQSPPRTRNRRNAPPAFEAASGDPDRLRARKVSANRLLGLLKGVLNHAHLKGKAADASAWVRRVEFYRDVNTARPDWLSFDEAQRLLNTCEPNLRNLLRVLLETGLRYSSATQLKVGDFHPSAGTITLVVGKTGKPLVVYLTPEGAQFFAQLCAGRARDELILRDPNGQQWGPSCADRPMREACRRVGIRAIGVNALRHTWASLAVMAGAPLVVVAQQLGHVDTQMVTRHYGHLAPSFVGDAIRAAAPRFQVEDDSNVRAIR